MEEVILIIYVSSIIIGKNLLTDEVGAIVFDPGSHSFRAGFGGEETPKVLVFILFIIIVQLN